MSIFDDIRKVRSEFDESWAIESLEAAERLGELRQQYNALAPDWSIAPAWAKWYTIDCANHVYIFDSEPLISYDNTQGYEVPCWMNNGKLEWIAHVAMLPFGIDWRLCKWQRPTIQCVKGAHRKNY